MSVYGREGGFEGWVCVCGVLGKMGQVYSPG